MKDTNKRNEKMRNLPKVKPVKPTVSKNMTESNKSSNAKSIIQNITNRYRVTAREARDIVTAVGTHLNAGNKKQAKAASSNIKKQLKETAVAAVTGKKGTTSDKTTVKIYKKKPSTYTEGTQR